MISSKLLMEKWSYEEWLILSVFLNYFQSAIYSFCLWLSLTVFMSMYITITNFWTYTLGNGMNLLISPVK